MEKCDKCGSFLQDANSLQRHVRKFHKATTSIPKMLCGICSDKFHTNAELESHTKLKHDLEVIHERLSFDNEDNFNRWRYVVETDLKVKYIRSSSKKKSEKRVIYYVCDQSGHPRSRVPDETRKRQLKLKGSRKTGLQCLSRMTVTLFASGSVVVDFCKTHVGHTLEFEDLSSSSRMKKQIALKVPTEEILEQVIDDVMNPNEQLKDSHLTPNHDNLNIEEFSSPCQSKFKEGWSELSIVDQEANLEYKAILRSLNQCKDTVAENLVVDKKEIQEAFYSILNNIETSKGAQVFLKAIKDAVPLVEAAEDLAMRFTNQTKVNTNKKISPQRRFQIKKKRIKEKPSGLTSANSC